FLVAEVIVERAFGDAGRVRDAVDRGALVAVTGEAIDGDEHELLSPAAGGLVPSVLGRRRRRRGNRWPSGHTKRLVCSAAECQEARNRPSQQTESSDRPRRPLVIHGARGYGTAPCSSGTGSLKRSGARARSRG